MRLVFIEDLADVLAFSSAHLGSWVGTSSISRSLSSMQMRSSFRSTVDNLSTSSIRFWLCRLKRETKFIRIIIFYVLPYYITSSFLRYDWNTSFKRPKTVWSGLVKLLNVKSNAWRPALTLNEMSSPAPLIFNDMSLLKPPPRVWLIERCAIRLPNDVLLSSDWFCKLLKFSSSML